jgi:Bacteriocin-protection, YdeI or OmpD-Associated
MKQVHITTRSQWRRWLVANHDREEDGIWLVFHLAKSSNAMTFFAQLAPTYQKQFIGWIVMAKRPETRAKRVEESLALLATGEKLGLK